MQYTLDIIILPQQYLSLFDKYLHPKIHWVLQEIIPTSGNCSQDKETRYSSRIAPINDTLERLAGCKTYENKPYPISLTLYGQYSKKPAGEKRLSF